MKVTIAIDSFKGCASSSELGKAIQRGIAPFVQESTVVPISDGGEGAIEMIARKFTGKNHFITSVNSFGEVIRASYYITIIARKKTAIIESANFIGIQFNQNRCQIDQGTSFGLGLAILDAVDQEVEQIVITLGGTGTTDGGLGMLQALGAQIFDKEDQLMTDGVSNPLFLANDINLNKVFENLGNTAIIVASDVTNPYSGKLGTAHVFGAQKGLNIKEIDLLDQQLIYFAKIMTEKGYPDLATMPGAGAAGGVGGALKLIGATMHPGFSLLSEFIGLEEQIKQSDFVITGEGRFDFQSQKGKVPYGIASLAQKYQIPTLLLCGSYEKIPEDNLFSGIFSIQKEPVRLEEALDTAYTLENIEILSHQLFQFLHSK